MLFPAWPNRPTCPARPTSQLSGSVPQIDSHGLPQPGSPVTSPMHRPSKAPTKHQAPGVTGETDRGIGINHFPSEFQPTWQVLGLGWQYETHPGNLPPV